MTKSELIAFEQEIADEYCAGKIRAPIHLSDGNEEQLISIFEKVHREDWVFSHWRSHYHALLHGIPRDLLRAKILAGDSITIMVPEHRFFATAIVGGNLPIALGVALALKKQGSNRQVWVFVGDMTYETGVCHEVVKYAENFDLPLNVVVEDNYESVGTPTQTVWGKPEPRKESSMPRQLGPKVWYYSYLKKWPHVGAGKWVTF
jgi:pyruvate dehydrogenase E1 component alpha subunit